MPMTEATIEDGGVGRGTTIVGARIDGLSDPYAMKTTILGTKAVPGTDLAGTTMMARTRDATIDAGRGRTQTMSAAAGHGVGSAAGAIPARLPARLAIQAILLFSRVCPAVSPSMRLVVRHTAGCLAHLRGSYRRTATLQYHFWRASRPLRVYTFWRRFRLVLTRLPSAPIILDQPLHPVSGGFRGHPDPALRR